MFEDNELEELFRSKAQSLEEKPKDLVWNKIESGLTQKKKRPIVEFTQSVWFSAAVFALIAIPYFVLFIINEQNQNIENQPIEIVKNDVAIPKTPIATDSSNAPQDTKSKTPEIVANEEVDNLKKTQILDEIEKEAKIAHVKVKKEENKIITNNELQKDVSSSPEIADVRPSSIVIDSISPALAANSVKAENIAPQAEKNITLARSKVVEGVTLSSSMDEQKPTEIIYKPNQFLILDPVYKVNFKLKAKKTNQIIFENKDFELSFYKEKDSIIIKSTIDINPEILKKLEENKKQIFDKYINPQ